MDLNVYRNGDSEDTDLGFAFNDFSFSDRIIQLEIIEELIDVCPNVKSSSTSANQTILGKRRREDIQKDNVEDLLLDQPDIHDSAACKPRDLEVDVMVEASMADDETVNPTNVADSLMDCSPVLKVRTLHINSSILAAKSMFFYKLFSNGMKESRQMHVTLRIHASEEAPFMELLNFMYNSSLNATSPPKLLDVFMAADKFDVPSCNKYCSRRLLNVPMTMEFALLYLELPLSVRMSNTARPLVIAAKKYLVARYKNITTHQEELMELPLAGIMALLSSDELQVASEDVVYDFVLTWAQTQYPSLEERRKILRANLIHFIRFPFMTCSKLKTVQTCNDFDHEVTSKVVFDALYFKSEAPHQQKILAAEFASTSHLFIERSYMYRPIKVVEFEHPHQQCVVYFDLKREECANLFPSGRVCSQPFHLGGQRFFLSAQCNMDPYRFYHCFGLFFGMQEIGSANFSVDYEFAIRSRPTLEYIRKYKGNFIFSGGNAVGYKNFFATPWTSFMAEDSLLFINDFLYFRAELTIKKQAEFQ
ncbi:BTB/POZ domain-containing protein POB1-like [Vicia villosa]|uniref:BTB/POZ domain-containing protein POB1-like n=1 Tax=Vicia villosa TaxID=3911 RepID=UPI00273BA1AD|nr:BTB/POZ domain-containing protein POB1-like [Vicia villosa]